MKLHRLKLLSDMDEIGLSPGRKDDAGKLRFGLLPWESVRVVVQVLEWGARKYGEQNWRRVSDGRNRYREALMRHAIQDIGGERLDSETGLPHLAHVATCALFALALDLAGGSDG